MTEHRNRYYKYCEAVRHAWRTGQLTGEQIRRLEQAGFVRDPKRRTSGVVRIEDGTTYDAPTTVAKTFGQKSGNLFRTLSAEDPARITFAGFHWIRAERWNALTPKEQQSLRGRCEGHTLRNSWVCAETGETFDSWRYMMQSMQLPNTTRAARGFGMIGGYHFLDGVTYRRLARHHPETIEHWSSRAGKRTFKQPVMCVETGVVYPSTIDAARSMGSEQGHSNIGRVRNDPGSTAYGYHWGDPDWVGSYTGEYTTPTGNRQTVVCVETGVEYPSGTAAANSFGGSGSAINSIINKPHRTAFGYHWGTPEWVREHGGEVTRSRKQHPIMCVETGVTYPTVKDAVADMGGRTCGLSGAINRIDRTVFGYHWGDPEWVREHRRECVKPQGNRRTVICVETGKEYASLNEAGRAAGSKAKDAGSSIRKALDDPNRTAHGFHWSTRKQKGKAK